jgi:hypothetical protein
MGFHYIVQTLGHAPTWEAVNQMRVNTLVLFLCGPGLFAIWVAVYLFREPFIPAMEARIEGKYYDLSHGGKWTTGTVTQIQTLSPTSRRIHFRFTHSNTTPSPTQDLHQSIRTASYITMSPAELEDGDTVAILATDEIAVLL